MTAQAKKDRLKQERREEIVQAALRVFVQRGVQGATMDGIAKEAELSKGTLYLYFQSKDELFLTIALEWVRELNARATEIEARQFEDGLGAFRCSMQTYIKHGLEHRDRFLVAMSWLTSSYSIDERSEIYEDYKAAVAQLQSYCCQSIERAKADGSLSTELPTARFAMQTWGAALGLILVEQNSHQISRRTSAPVCLDGIGSEFFEMILSKTCPIALKTSLAPTLALVKGTDS
jgi:AcrR family transcriptional regulator